MAARKGEILLKKRYFTAEEKRYIEENYPIKTVKEVADNLGVKKQNLIAYAHRHGISNNRYWTIEEEEYLLDKYGVMTAAAIGKKLGKTTRQVIEKVQKLGIGNFLENNENLCLAEVCRLVNRDKETIKKTWFKNGLKWKKKGKYTIVKPSDLFDFMRKNTCYWDATQCEKWYFERYDWFREKLLADRADLHNKRWGVL